MKVLAIDIETAPNTAHVWGLFKQNVGINQIMQTGRVMCFASKWVGTRGVTFYSEHTNGHKRTIKEAHKLLDEADAVLTYNGRSFDLPTLNREFIKIGLGPPSPYHQIDLLAVARAQFRFASNKLDHVCKELGLGSKTKHAGHELWVQCMKGDPKAWAVMERYNKQDVLLLEKLYKNMMPWIQSHPNAALFQPQTDTPTCTNCGSKCVHKRGIQTTQVHQYQRYRCDDCGTWMRSRYTLTKKSQVLKQVA